MRNEYKGNLNTDYMSTGQVSVESQLHLPGGTVASQSSMLATKSARTVPKRALRGDEWTDDIVRAILGRLGCQSVRVCVLVGVGWFLTGYRASPHVPGLVCFDVCVCVCVLMYVCVCSMCVCVCVCMCVCVYRWGYILPLELLLLILEFLDPVDLCRARLVCTRWAYAGQEDSLWKGLCARPWTAVGGPRRIDTGRWRHNLTWKDRFVHSVRTHRNWLAGRYTEHAVKTHSNAVRCLDFDEEIIVSGSADQTVKIWVRRVCVCVCVCVCACVCGVCVRMFTY